MVERLRELPSVERLLQSPAGSAWTAQFGRPLTLQAIRTVLAWERERLLQEGSAAAPAEENLLAVVQEQLEAWSSASLQPVINATGVILHTNLGRAPLSIAAIEAARIAAQGYTNLEFDLARGTRGSRLDHAGPLLCRLTGAEAALVVNNNAAAVLLCLTALAR